MTLTRPWGIEHIPETERRKQVANVRITIHSLGPVVAGGQLSQNNWTIELLVSGGCIRLDMKLYDPNSTTDFRGVLSVQLLPSQLSQNYVSYLDYALSRRLKVWHFTNNIIEKGRHRYNMTSSGVRCRH